MNGKVKQRITADYILDIYAESKRKKGKEAADLLALAKKLSTHLNEILVIPENTPKFKQKP